ncbi:hypothetical protein ACFOYW_15960 [Gryllotalpicola reticulitermitis]|uniref:Tryptophan 2,3-dioxygenase n=1 Tax=Gryllotalpicola reticulitermitis TaxID=1184153 RepID=A0ABV8QD15_9MICO
MRPEFDIGKESPYDDYVRFSTALGAIPEPEPGDPPDNVLFQTIHLMTEFAWYNIHYELGNAADRLDLDDFAASASLVRRAQRWQRAALQALELLDSELSQEQFLQIREQLPAGGSGLDSPGFKNLRPMTNYLWARFEAASTRAGVDLERMAQADFGARSSEAGIAAVANELLELDKELISWQQFHVRLVWSKLGGHPAGRRHGSDGHGGSANARSLTGRPVQVLDGFTRRVSFPRLWALVDAVYDRVNSAPADDESDLT